jgi:hypothetical protein
MRRPVTGADPRHVDLARRFGEVCAQCGQDLEAGGPVVKMWFEIPLRASLYRHPGATGRALAPACARCHPQWRPWDPAYEGLEEHTCAGCARPVWTEPPRIYQRREPWGEPIGEPGVERVTCSQRCTRRASQRKPAARSACEVCGRDLELLARAETRYCSGACKQRAYRERLALSKAGARL